MSQLDWLYSTQLFGIKLGLQGVTRLLQACGVAETTARVVHVAGTNGKGSTCAFAESLARAAGEKTGLFTSPHLVRFNERIRVNGVEIPTADVERLIAHLRGIVATWETAPTFFELVFALALLYFKEQGCSLIVLETGMGGRLDATNALRKDVALLAPIGLDHTQYLGDTLTDIAGEKAAIIQADTPVFSSPQAAEVEGVIRAYADAVDAPCGFIETPLPPSMKLGLLGEHQAYNAALALAGVKSIISLDEATLQRGLAQVTWAGRFERMGENLILDGAHNPHAMRALVATWRAQYGSKTCRCLFAASADKEIGETLEILSPIVHEWILPPVDSPRIMPPAELAALVSQSSGAPIIIAERLADCLEAPALTLVCGSFFLLGEFKSLQENAADFRSTQQ